MKAFGSKKSNVMLGLKCRFSNFSERAGFRILKREAAEQSYFSFPKFRKFFMFDFYCCRWCGLDKISKIK